MVPGAAWGEIEMALAANRLEHRTGYYCTWINVRREANCAFSLDMPHNLVIPIPIAHAEGRFTTGEEDLVEILERDGQIAFRYCDSGGLVGDEFPVNPNGSVGAFAGVTNPRGNILAFMPHPERASWLRQVPVSTQGVWGARRLGAQGNLKLLDAPGPGTPFFTSMKRYIEREGIAS